MNRVTDSDSGVLGTADGGLVGRLASSLLKIDALDRLAAAVSDASDEDRFERVLAEMGLGFSTTEEQLARIPSTGPVIVVANHPFGLAEGIVLQAFHPRRGAQQRALPVRRLVSSCVSNGAAAARAREQARSPHHLPGGKADRLRQDPAPWITRSRDAVHARAMLPSGTRAFSARPRQAANPRVDAEGRIRGVFARRHAARDRAARRGSLPCTLRSAVGAPGDRARRAGDPGGDRPPAGDHLLADRGGHREGAGSRRA